jgi:hypothetical protein
MLPLKGSKKIETGGAESLSLFPVLRRHFFLLPLLPETLEPDFPCRACGVGSLFLKTKLNE